jgi:hypothetical protein
VTVDVASTTLNSASGDEAHRTRCLGRVRFAVVDDLEQNLVQLGVVDDVAELADECAAKSLCSARTALP